MLFKEKLHLLLSFLILIAAALILNISARAQEIPAEDDINKPVVDSIDIQENLLDSNEVYKQKFDSLSEEGDWVKINKSDFIRDLNYDTGENFELSDEYTSDVIYIWRPYCANEFWNPYTNGSWLFTEQGWLWSSYYNWGWGPYNYGRWYYSGLYGWSWIPGGAWACNWVTWRQYNNYVGWYPTCPRVYWRGPTNIIYSNRLFTYVPRNWVFVDKKDFTKKIDNTTIAASGNNSKILKGSQKIKTAIYVDPSSPKIKYNGPDVNVVSQETGQNISPKKVTVKESDGREYADQKSIPSTKNNSVKPKEGNNNTKSGNTNSKKRTKEVKNNTKPSVNTPSNDGGTMKTQKGNNGKKQSDGSKKSIKTGKDSNSGTKRSSNSGDRK